MSAGAGGSERAGAVGVPAAVLSRVPAQRADAERPRPVYLNNAATSFPKPQRVVDAVVRALGAPPADTGRGGGEADPRAECRRLLAALLGVPDPLRVVLLPSATHALNLVIGGLATVGGHVVTTPLEHNSVLRPLAHLARDRGIGVTIVRPERTGRLSPAAFAAALDRGTCLAVVNHASNVSGGIQPIEEIAELVARAGVPLLVDASQSAGILPIDHEALPGRVFVAFSGHKALLGPAGVGALIVPDDSLPQDVVGGTGAQSESVLHPAQLPLRHEAGTPNLPGIAGLCAGVRAVAECGVERGGRQRAELVRELTGELGRIPGVRLVPVAADDGRVGVLSFNLAGWDPRDVGFALREVFGIEVRAGLHCAPLAHRFLGTAPLGTVRVSFGSHSTLPDAVALFDAVACLARA